VNLALSFNPRSSITTQTRLLNWIEVTQKNGRKSVSTQYIIIVQFDSYRFANDSTYYLRFRGVSVSSEKKHGKDHVQNDVSGNHFVYVLDKLG
jgi:hypothetical protein